MIIELKKLLKYKLTYISFGIMILIVIGNTWMGSRLFFQEYTLAKRLFANYPDQLALESVPLGYWAVSYGSFFAALYYFIFPLLIALPIVDTIYRERSSGNQRYQMMRMSRFSYYLKKFLFTFGVSFLFFILPLLLDMFIMNLITGKWDYSDYSRAYHKLVNGTALLGDGTSEEKRELFSPLMEISPYLYTLVYLMIGGLYAGLYTSFGLASSLYMKNRYLILFTPFILYIGYWIIFSLLDFLAWDPFNFLAAKEPVNNMSYPPFIVVFALLMALTLILYIAGVRKQDDLFE